MCWSGDDPGPERCEGLVGERLYGHPERLSQPVLMVQETLKRDPISGPLFVFRGWSGGLIKVIWHDGQGAKAHLKRRRQQRVANGDRQMVPPIGRSTHYGLSVELLTGTIAGEGFLEIPTSRLYRRGRAATPRRLN
ncbi:IS66 family insertion sequence element accessory protein TnpB [Sinorhizobium meliloti]|uniref:IS66 family insertion sequence element accessory protein TnpB n=1 Tax=Rhizobium meliloti TaxID=382 RepID=UPI003F5CE1A1